MQRAETGRLLHRGGIQNAFNKDGLTERLQRFINHRKAFAVPNKKAAYELTLIIVYLSEYGHQNPDINSEAFN